MTMSSCPGTAPVPGVVPPAVRRVLADHAGEGGVIVATAATHSEALEPLALFASADQLLDGRRARVLRAGLTAWREGAVVWIRLRCVDDLREAPVVVEQRPNPAEVATLPPVADPGTGRLVWAWSDRRCGAIAARGSTDARTEDLNVAVHGVAALARRLHRPLLVRFPDGSVTFTRPAPAGHVEIGGRVEPLPAAREQDEAQR